MIWGFELKIRCLFQDAIPAKYNVDTKNIEINIRFKNLNRKNQWMTLNNIKITDFF